MANPKKSDQRSADVQHDQGVRQDEQGVTQDEQRVTQDEQGVTQDEQGATQEEQGATQIEQGVTQIEQGITQVQQGATQVAQGIEQEAQASAMAAQSFDILAVTEGVQVLASEVQTLNERVYTKTQLDRQRNALVLAAFVTFVVLGSILSLVLFQIKDGNKAEEVRAAERAHESTEFRHQLADCTLRPGTVLQDGFVNPGVCYTDGNQRATDFINSAIDRIFNGLRSSEDCLYLRGQNVRPPACSDVNGRVDALKAGGDPFRTSTIASTSTTTTTAAMATTTTAPPRRSSPTPVDNGAVAPPTSVPARSLLAVLVCIVLVVVGGC